MLPWIGLAGIILCLLCAIVWLAYRPLRGRDNANWLVAQETIQSVGTMIVYAGRDSYSTDVSDYYFKVNDEFYSGRLMVADVAYSTDRSPRVLVGQTIQVRYDHGTRKIIRWQRPSLIAFGYPRFTSRLDRMSKRLSSTSTRSESKLWRVSDGPPWFGSLAGD